MIPLQRLSISAACLAAAACGGGPTELDTITNPAPCPQASVLFDAARYVEMFGEERLANVGFTGEILGVRSLCRYADGEPIESDLEIEFAFGRGPSANGYDNTYPYFVAVTRRDRAVITKRTFAVSADFDDADIVYGSDEIRRITIPRADDGVAGSNFEILVGFELTPEQLAFNRSGVRFRPNVGTFEAPEG